jgi:hypothetical protein
MSRFDTDEAEDVCVNVASRQSLTAGGQGSYPAAVVTVVLGMVVTAMPVVFHLAGQPIAIALCVLLSAILACVATASVPIALIISYLFQNLFVALVSPQITSIEQLNSIRAYNFVMTATVWLVLTASYWLERRTIERRMCLTIDVTTAALVLIGAYFVLGVVSNPENAATYLRNIAAPFLLFQIFALVAYRHPVPFIKPLAILAAVAVAYGFFELLAQKELFRLVNGDVYINWRVRQEFDSGVWLRDLQETGRVMRGYLDTLVIDFLNTPLLRDSGIQLYRLVGPNFHSISFAYALVFLAIVLAAAGRWWWPLLVVAPTLVIGSKGALVTFVLVLTFLLLSRGLQTFRQLAWSLLALAAYAIAGVVVGIRASDYHVIGFIGGLRGFLANPLGRGIGAGGNLSLTVSSFDWSRSQQLGHTDVALESAVGVLLYQMGIAGLVILGVLFWIVLMLWRHYRLTGQSLFAAAALGIAAITVNGIFQEEALFAPLALGLMCAFGGLMLGSAYRGAPARLALRPVLRPAVAS